MNPYENQTVRTKSTIYLNNRIGSAALLPPEYTPGNWDIICQRGKDCPKHVGNRRFRVCIENHVDSYMTAKTKHDKSCVISSIIQSIKESSPNTGGFVMKDHKLKKWTRVDSKIARDKVGNALRDAAKQRSENADLPTNSSSNNSLLGKANKPESPLSQSGLYCSKSKAAAKESILNEKSKTMERAYAGVSIGQIFFGNKNQVPDACRSNVADNSSAKNKATSKSYDPAFPGVLENINIMDLEPTPMKSDL